MIGAMEKDYQNCLQNPDLMGYTYKSTLKRALVLPRDLDKEQIIDGLKNKVLTEKEEKYFQKYPRRKLVPRFS